MSAGGIERRGRIVGRGVELDAMAGGEEHGLGVGMSHAPGGQGVDAFVPA